MNFRDWSLKLSMEYEYQEEDFLQLSGIQHFLFCRRQWALIHIEQQWQENYWTVDGRIMHENVHDSSFRTTRGDVITIRALRVHSNRLGVSGECDAVEFHANACGIKLAKTNGTWIPFPVEYKRGKPKEDIYDRAQLCAQAMCLEEMFCCSVKEGALYYGEPRRREIIKFTEELRNKVEKAFSEMHQLFKKGYTPKVTPKKACKSCSLSDKCLPELMDIQSVEDYMRKSL